MGEGKKKKKRLFYWELPLKIAIYLEGACMDLASNNAIRTLRKNIPSGNYYYQRTRRKETVIPIPL